MALIASKIKFFDSSLTTQSNFLEDFLDFLEDSPDSLFSDFLEGFPNSSLSHPLPISLSGSLSDSSDELFSKS